MENKNNNWIKTFLKKIIKRIFDYFVQGLIFVAPIAITIYVIVALFEFIDNIAQVYLVKIMPFRIPGIGIILMFVLITIFGFIGHRIITAPFKIIIEKSLNKAPFVQLVYTSIRDLISAFVGKKKKFNQPVLVRIEPLGSIEMLGFLTVTDLETIGRKDKVAVYFPYSYAFMGQLLIVPKEWITPLNINSAEVMKFIVSGGVAKIDEKQENDAKNLN